MCVHRVSIGFRLPRSQLSEYTNALALSRSHAPISFLFHIKTPASFSQKTHENNLIYLLDIIIRQRTPVLQLLPSEDQTLLVRRDALFVLDLGLDIVDSVGGFDLEGDGFAREGFDEAGWSVRVECQGGWGMGC